MKNIEVKLIFLMSSALIACEAMAECTVGTVNFNVDLGVVNVPVNLPIGMAVTGWAPFNDRTLDPTFHCTPNSVFRPTISTALGSAGNYSESGRSYTVFRLGTTGVGIVLEAQAPGASPVSLEFQQVKQITSINTGPSTTFRTFQLRYRLIKLARLSSGTIPFMRVAQSYAEGTTGVSMNFWIVGGQINTPITTCNLAGGDVNRTIALPHVQTTDFTGNSTGVRSFELTANCDNAVSLTFEFSGAADNTDGLRFRNAATGSGAASGVGIWLYSRIGGGTQTIPANGNIADRQRMVAISANRAVLPLGAAYWRTGTVKKGAVTTPMTVSISYD